MKNNNNIFDSINFEDIKKARFSMDSRNIFMKNIALRFPTTLASSRFWLDLTEFWQSSDEYIDYDFSSWLLALCKENGGEITVAETAEYQEAEDVPTHFRKAINLVIAAKKSFYGNPLKIVRSGENAFIMQAYNMQDCLFYTIETFSPDADKELLFRYYAFTLTSLLWYSDFYGEEEFVRLLRYFFNRYLPLLRGAAASFSSTGKGNQG